ncbi:MAG: hypothetical protein LBO78_01600, partial [Rickettsiales bacterium]|nr:hypothetical protein [Rickettsiales bacterium]
IVDNKGVEIVKPDYFDDITQFDVNNQARAVNYKDNVRVLLDMKGRIVKNLGKGKVPDALMYPTRAPAKAKPAAKVPEKAPAPAPAPAKKK